MRFWGVDQFKTRHLVLTDNDRIYEVIFKSTNTKNTSGRFVVKIPLRLGQHLLRESKEAAEKQFVSLERTLQKEPGIRIMFMKEYEQLGHMEKVNNTSYSKKFFFHTIL